MSTTTATSRPARRRSPAPPAGMAGLLLALAAAIPATIPAAEGGGTDVVTQPSYTPMWNDYDINSGVAAVGANKLHDIGIVGQGVTAALVESGFNTDHEIFDGKIVNNYTGPGGDHGTHVAGTVAAMAPGAMLWLDNYTGGNTVNAYETIAANAAQYNIAAVNNSWSGTINGRYLTPAEVEAAYPDIAAAVQELLNEEVAVVGSSGELCT